MLWQIVGHLEIRREIQNIQNVIKRVYESQNIASQNKLFIAVV